MFLLFHRFLPALLAAMLIPIVSMAKGSADLVHTYTKNAGICFIENKGQMTDQQGNPRRDIDFKVELNGVQIFINAGELHYQWTKPVTTDDQNLTSTEIYRLDMSLAGANKNALVITEDQQAYYELHYGKTYGSGIKARAFRKITYKDIYPHIDWVIYSNGSELKYDFIVHPGGHIDKIKLKYAGAETIGLKDGALCIATPYGSITEQKPYCYEEATGKEIASAYIQNGVMAGIEVAAHKGTLVIDPVLSWATYYGTDPVVDYSAGLGTDAKGNVYMGGTTYSNNNIATIGAHKYVLTAPSADIGDAYLVKFDAAGQRQWATYYGGDQKDELSDLVVSTAGDIYITGFTLSDTGIATPGSHQPSYGGGPLLAGDTYLARFNTDGIREWGTYYGGFMMDHNPRLAIDGDNNIYLAGTTTSSNDIASATAPQPMLYGGQDGFIAKFTNKGKRIWATYCGGEMYNEGIEAITTDKDGNVYVGGFTTSELNIATPGTHQEVFHIHNSATITDAFVMKYDGNGNKLWGTYYGGVDYDYLEALVCDKNNNVYLSGRTLSPDKIATSGVQQETHTNTADYDGYVAKLSPNGGRIWGSYFGGNGFDEVKDLSFDKKGMLYVSGTTYAHGMATPGSYQQHFNGDAETFIATFNPDGRRTYATYFGGNNFDQLMCLKPDRRGNFFICGNTSSTSGIATATAFKNSFSGSSTLYDAFLARFDRDSTVFFDQLFTQTDFCAGDTFRITYGVTRAYNPGNVFTVELSNAAGSFSMPVTIGATTAVSAGSILCYIPTGIAIGNRYRIRIVATNKADTSFDNGVNFHIGQMPVVRAFANAPVCEGDTIELDMDINLPGVAQRWYGPNNYTADTKKASVKNVKTTASGNYIAEAKLYGCTAYDTAIVVVNPIPATPEITSNSPVCAGGTLQFFATGTASASYQWSGPNSFSANTSNPRIANVDMNAYGVYTIVARLNGCTSPEAYYTAVVKPIPDKPEAYSNSPVCEEDSLTLRTGNIQNGLLYSWTGPGGYTSSQTEAVIAKAALDNDGVYLLTANLNGCTQSNTVLVHIKPKPKPIIVSNSPVQENGSIELSVNPALPGATYYWTGPAGFTYTGGTVRITNATESNSGSYTVTGTLDGCTGIGATDVLVQEITEDVFILFPNPNNGNFKVKGRLQEKRDIPFEIVTATGQLVYGAIIPVANKHFEAGINLNGRLSSGVYYIRVKLTDGIRNIPFSVSR